MGKELLITICIPNYPKEALISKATRAKYIKPREKLLLKYLGRELHTEEVPKISINSYGKDRKGIYHLLAEGFTWRKERLHNTKTGEDIIKNPDQVGKERWIPIKGQDFYNQNIHEFTRNKIVAFLKNFWAQELTKYSRSPSLSLQGKHYPVSIHIDYRDTLHDLSDLDNYSFPYHKTLLDSLKDVGMIVDDKIRYINGLKLTHTPLEESNMETLTKSWGQNAIRTVTIKIYGNANRV